MSTSSRGNLMLRLYTQNDCIQCKKMEQQLDMWGYDYKIINTSHNLEAKKFLNNRNHDTLPVLYDRSGMFHLNVAEDFNKEILEEELKALTEGWPERAECDFAWRQQHDAG